MSASPRDTGAAVEPEHLVQLYESDEHLEGVIVDYLEKGLERGHAVLLVVTPQRWQAIERGLAGRGREASTLRATHRLAVLDAETMLSRFMVGGRPDRLRFEAAASAALDGFGHPPGISVYGEMVDVLWRAGESEAAIELEAHWNELQRHRSFSLLCAYGSDGFTDAADLLRVCGAHTHVLPPESGGDEPVVLPPEQVRAMAVEIAQRKEIERALRQSLHRERAASRAKDEFLAMLGHELRNPLSPIVTALQLMNLRIGDVAVRERAIIDRQVRHLVALVDDLLDVSRITRGKIEIKRGRVDVAEVLAKAIEQASPLLEQRTHHLETAVAPGLVVCGDEHRLAQIVANLLSNAARYTEVGGFIQVSAERQGDLAVIRVRDDGEGIQPELLPHLFELFVQGERSLDRSTGGLGLGLAITRRLVELHGGTVTAHSDGLGRGSEFVVRLPLAGPVLAPGPEPVPVRSAARRRILVVDDNRDAAELLAEALRAAGHLTRVEFGSRRALECLAEFPAEVALIDIGLPEMDGYELARRLREVRDLRVVAVTGYGQPSDRDRATAAGFDAHFVKPVDLEHIEGTLIRLFEVPEAR